MKFGWNCAAALLGVILTCCAPEPGRQSSGGPAPAAAQSEPKVVQLPANDAKRLQTIMTPLIQHMDHPIPLNQVKIGLWQDDHINAANAGGGNFLVTTGLLRKANDDQLRGILAHETAHADLGHVAKTQNLSSLAELGIGLLDQIYPGSSAITPIFGEALISHYSRGEESEADAHGVVLLKRSGFDGKTVMANSLAWIARTEGDSGGGFFDSHPATGDRIAAVKALP